MIVRFISKTTHKKFPAKERISMFTCKLKTEFCVKDLSYYDRTSLILNKIYEK